MIRLILGLILFSAQAFAGQVTLLVSVNGKSGPFFHRQETAKRLVDQFKRHYRGDLRDLKVIAQATQEDLHRELLNPQNEALFWVSHANSFADASGGLQTENVILDVEGSNVKDVFQKIHPRLNFLAVLGCRAAPIFDALKKKGLLSGDDQLVIYAREKKINGMKEIKRALSAFQVTADSSSKNCPVLEGHAIRLTRTIGATAGKSLKVMNREKFLGLFPAGVPGEIQTLTLHVPNPASVHDLKLLIDAGERVRIQSDAFAGEWKVFADSAGRPIGVGEHVYRFVGQPQPTMYPETFRPFECQ